MNIKVSVIIPVYNGEALIERAINSVLAQTLTPLEVIVVNDGSKDATSEKLMSFGNKITVIAIPNGGVSNARNVGIKASSGDLVAFLDADDVWFEDKIKRQVDVFTHDQNVGFTCCNFMYFDQRSKLMTNHFSRFENEKDMVFDAPLPLPLNALIKRNFVGTCSNVMIKKEVLNKVGFFNVNYKQAEDYDLWLRCALVTKFVLTSTVHLEKKGHDTNLTNDFLETLLFHEQVLINLPSNRLVVEQVKNIKDQYQSALSSVRYEIGNLMYESGQKINAFKYLFLGLVTTLTFKNLILFCRCFTRKLVRTMSLGLIRNMKS